MDNNNSDKRKHAIIHAADQGCTFYLLLHLLGWFFGNRFGGFILLTVMATFGSAMIVAWLVNLISWYALDSHFTVDGGQWWLWAICIPFGMLCATVTLFSPKSNLLSRADTGRSPISGQSARRSL